MNLDERLKAAAEAVRELYPEPTPGIARLDVSEAALIADLKAIAVRREREGLLAEQRHQLLDLDADSTCPIEGACRYPYLSLGGQS